MITRDEAEGLRSQLMAVLAEDAHNTDRLLGRLDAISRETGIGAHAALLLILTRLAFEDGEARRHWELILAHHRKVCAALGRDLGVRVALLDYFMNVNRRLVQPALIDLEMFESSERSRPVDSLTGLGTDRTFRSAVQSELRRAKRYDQKVSVVLFDLDEFASVNRRVGELIGDRVLKEAAILLHNTVRDIDATARPGEDELALLLPETDRNGALLVAERFRRELETHFSRREVAGATLDLTVSGGIASYPEDANAPETLLERAAQALYRAKASGRNQVSVYYPERRRYLRFDLEPGRFEVEVLTPKEIGRARPGNLSRNGIVFASPEVLEVGEEIEVRLVNRGRSSDPSTARIRGRVVRLEEVPEVDPLGAENGPPPEADDRYEVGVVFDLDFADGEKTLVEFLERARAGGASSRP